MGNRVTIEETLVRVGFQTKVERGEAPASRNLGEIAIDEYATRLALSGSPTFLPVVLFEDLNVLETRIARLPRPPSEYRRLDQSPDRRTDHQRRPAVDRGDQRGTPFTAQAF
jgi:hypothetical protein